MMALLLFSACEPSHQKEVDELNNRAYAFHYRNIDSTELLARKALNLSADYDDGRAEALNNLAFVNIIRMNFIDAYKQLFQAIDATDNQIELLISDIQLMRIAQRQSRNKEFYDYRERALRRLDRIHENMTDLNEHQRSRWIYAESEFQIISATYFYYVGQDESFVKSLEDINPNEIERDTAQYLNYLYNIGAGGAISGSPEEVAQMEFNNLVNCYILAGNRYPYWQAQAMQAISEHMVQPKVRNYLIKNNLQTIKYLNIDQMPDSLLAGNLAQRSLYLFEDYGDVYQIAGAQRTLASNFWYIKDYRSALICLHDALRDSKINQAPDLVASIRERLCITYSAVDNKAASDNNRNIYLDLQNETRQDRFLESRAAQLDDTLLSLNVILGAVIVLMIFIIVLLFVLSNKRKKRNSAETTSNLLMPLKEWQQRNENQIAQLNDEYEEIEEEQAISRMHIQKSRIRSLEQRAKISLVNSITPFIDRMINEVNRLNKGGDSDRVRGERYEYISEITSRINDYNNVLTQWIQMRQGELSLHIESFPLQPVLDIVRKGRMGYQLKGIELDVCDSDAVVKADRILTLFMINTIADNARKFTPEGGKVSIRVNTTDDYVEIGIFDTGQGMTDEQIAHAFDRTYTGGHGFGLLNCKGIIEKYKKISSIFSVCDIRCQSKLGEGSQFFFRLPVGGRKSPVRSVTRVLLPLLMLLGFALPSFGQLTKASQYADKAYQSNLNGHYDSTFIYGDSAFIMIRKSRLVTPEDSLHANNIRLTVYNENAVAALALHQWSVYRSNNISYTSLLKDISADNTLESYVRQMQQSEINRNVAIVILILLLLLIFPLYYLFFYRHQLFYRYCVERVGAINDVLLSDVSDEEKLERITQLWDNSLFQRSGSRRMAIIQQLNEVVERIREALKQSISVDKDKRQEIELAHDELERSQYENNRLYVSNAVLDNCLSTLKHETMYYPSRIAQLIDGSDRNLDSISELVTYYKDLYTILSSQAMYQVKSVALRSDDDMLRYLLDLLAKTCHQKKIGYTIKEIDSSYVIITVPMPGLQLTDSQVQDYFTPLTSNLDMLLCRQIVRDYGEITNLRGSGIQARRSEEGGVIVEIILPQKICKTLKSSL